LSKGSKVRQGMSCSSAANANMRQSVQPPSGCTGANADYDRARP